MLDTPLYVYLSAGAALFVFWDAGRRRAAARWGWVAGTAIAWPLVLPLWMATRPLQPGEIRGGGRAWNVSKYFALVWTILWGTHALLALVVAVAVGWTNRDAPDVGAGIGLVVLLAVVYVAVWLLPAGSALCVGWLLRKREVIEQGPPQTAPTAPAGDAPLT
ncbi:MAG: hypothetical protein ACRD2X_06815 [Vicinamibacteraceae bacterium]